MEDHLHTGPVQFLFVGISALVFLNLWRLAAAKLADSENVTLAALGRTGGSLVKF
jgi:hypothetical protein